MCSDFHVSRDCLLFQNVNRHHIETGYRKDLGVVYCAIYHGRRLSHRGESCYNYKRLKSKNSTLNNLSWHTSYFIKENWSKVILMTLRIQVIFTAAEYYITNDTTTWEDVTCTLATPTLNYTSEGVTYTLESDFQLDDSVGPVWIGYYTAYRSFQYYGIPHLNSVKNLWNLCKKSM